jgi:hypothetical protein
MYTLTINYLDGTTTVDSYETFPQVQKHIKFIDRLVDSLEVRYQVESDELTEEFNGDESSHSSWGI